jgi:hypothetical protein
MPNPDMHLSTPGCKINENVIYTWTLFVPLTREALSLWFAFITCAFTAIVGTCQLG